MRALAHTLLLIPEQLLHSAPDITTGTTEPLKDQRLFFFFFLGAQESRLNVLHCKSPGHPCGLALRGPFQEFLHTGARQQQLATFL